jgi:hypothetical protein
MPDSAFLKSFIANFPKRVEKFNLIDVRTARICYINDEFGMPMFKGVEYTNIKRL